MDVLVINLDDRVDRRAHVESGFAEINNRDWRLFRISAVKAAEVSADQINGPIAPAEAACFFSHVKALDEAVNSPDHVMIVEDDIRFGPNSQAAIEAAIAGMPEDGWDILFTDVGTPHADGMIDLFRQRVLLAPGGAFRLIDLQDRSFSGSTAYVVNKRSKHKLLSIIAEEAQRIACPYDIYLRFLIQRGRLKSFLIFPFATTISHFSDQSQIQAHAGSADLIWNAFRRLMWMDRDIDHAMSPVRGAKWHTNDQFELQAMSELLATMLSSGFSSK